MKMDKKLKITFLIIKRDMTNKIINYLKEMGFEDYFSFYGKGSASIAVLEYLGIGESENNILLYPSGEEQSKALMDIIRECDYLKDIIAFRVPVKGISNMTVLNHFLEGEN